MSHHGKLRESKRCENCGHFVEKRFCPECGQENIETRQRFYYLFTHFVEDFVHYDGRFWKTIQYLLFRPAKLTKEYLAGKRNRYVPPVTLYIFVSFITFFIPAILPAGSEPQSKEKAKQETVAEKQKATDSKDNSAQQTNENKKEITKPKETETKINSKLQEKIDSKNLEKQGETDSEKKTSTLKLQGRNKSVDEEELTKLEEELNKFDKEKWEERIVHDFPKAVFIYMPFFAFWLWLFHSKKQWLYFDHGIFTLHYFSFTLLSILLLILINWILSFFHWEESLINSLIKIVVICYMIYYFFHSHRLVYRERKAVSRLKCSILFIINSFFMLIFIALYVFIETFISNPGLVKEGWVALKGLDLFS